MSLSWVKGPAHRFASQSELWDCSTISPAKGKEALLSITTQVIKHSPALKSKDLTSSAQCSSPEMAQFIPKTLWPGLITWPHIPIMGLGREEIQNTGGKHKSPHKITSNSQMLKHSYSKTETGLRTYFKNTRKIVPNVVPTDGVVFSSLPPGW